MSRAVGPRRDTLPPLRPLPPRIARRQAWRRTWRGAGVWILRLTVLVGWWFLVWAITGAWVRP